MLFKNIALRIAWAADGTPENCQQWGLVEEREPARRQRKDKQRKVGEETKKSANTKARGQACSVLGKT